MYENLYKNLMGLLNIVLTAVLIMVIGPGMASAANFFWCTDQQRTRIGLDMRYNHAMLLHIARIN